MGTYLRKRIWPIIWRSGWAQDRPKFHSCNRETALDGKRLASEVVFFANLISRDRQKTANSGHPPPSGVDPLQPFAKD